MLRKNKNIFIITIAVGIIIFFNCSCLAAISVSEIINNMRKAYEKQMVGINDYTIVQKATGGIAAMAGETTVYYKRAKVDGEEIYKTRTESQPMGMAYVSIYDGKYNWTPNFMTGEIEKELAGSNPAQFWKNIDLAQTKYLGEEVLDGEKAYVLQIDNALQVIASQQGVPIEEGESQEASGKLWISSKTWMPLRMQLIMKADSEEMIMNTVATTDYTDYRQVGSMLHPFQLVVNMTTEMDTSGMSAEDRKNSEQTMQMMQSMMAGMGSFTIETVDIKINTGLSDDLFDGTKLK
ncbi:MAG: hypothetical protein XE03_1868 [candidate division TA06 bacterium 34_109]|uniref:Outer membrane lipoprotein-sorting protein n=1 Tax=candidate division TA06 bacterium 34_109 TaxID=1635277 RepID=A0A101HZ93_UNCT6|nr:MAG: hypothetical protein XE03_1868 [candidate division TA06 bacterium 34_109]